MNNRPDRSATVGMCEAHTKNMSKQQLQDTNQRYQLLLQEDSNFSCKEYLYSFYRFSNYMLYNIC